jgi:circadian clock protein KaiB
MDSPYRSTCHQKKRPAKPQTAKACGAAKSGGKYDAWNLRLYIAGQTTKSISAIANLKRICEHHIPARYHIEVIDLMQKPHLARYDKIVAIPTLIRSIPAPIKRVFGDLSATERVLLGLDLRV